MKSLTLILTVMLSITTIGVAFAMNTIENLEVGKINLSFSPSNGFSMNYGGASVIKESSLRVMKPGWLFTYYSYDMGKQDIVINDIPNGKEAIIHHKTEWFEGEHRATILENKVTFDLKYKLTADVNDAGIEYNLGYISGPLIVGRSYHAESNEGPESGTIPLKPLSASWDGFVTKSCIDKMTIDSRIGEITIETNGEPNDLWLVDYRGLRVTWAEKYPIFMLGAPRKELKPNEEHHSIVSFTFDPPVERVRPAVDSKKITAPIEEVNALHKTCPHPVVVIPEPKEMKMRDGDFILTDQTQIVVGDIAKEEDLRGAKSFATEVHSLYDIKLQIVRESEASSESLILVGEAALNSKAAKAAKVEKISAPDKEEGYALRVTPKQVLVIGHDQRGSYYGMQTLKQLVKVAAEAVSLQGCDINDYPSLPFRGIHIYTGNKALPFHRKLVDRILSRFKMNHMILEVDQIKWKSAPETEVSFAMSQEDVKKDIEQANEHFMDVSPQISSLGHMHWMFANKQHLDLAEDPAYPYAYCPSKQESYDFVFKVYDEAIELFGHPKYFHIGHDEVTSVEAEFPFDEVCKKKSVADLFLEDTLRVYDHLKKKGVQVMMWGDMLLAPGESPDACNMKDPKDADRLRKALPKDIIITDWHYAIEPPEEFHSLKLFQDQGLKCIAAGWYTPQNILNFTRAAKDNNSMGYLQTTWAGFDSNENNLVENRDQFTAYVLAAEYAWNSGKTDLEKLPYQADAAFFDQWNRSPVVRQSLKGFTMNLSALYNISLANTATETNWVGIAPEDDMSSAPTGITRLKDNLFHLANSTSAKSGIRLSSALDDQTDYPEFVEIPIGRKANALEFLHTCTWSDTPGREVGAYIINYEDGTSKEITLRYRENITAWSDKASSPNAITAWSSETKSGQNISLREIDWQNPSPGKIIRSITLHSANTDAGIMLLGVSGITE